ncbi:MAG: SpoIIE family protein phosphatase [Candidatus Zhuqueibacterota bacterium]
MGKFVLMINTTNTLCERIASFLTAEGFSVMSAPKVESVRERRPDFIVLEDNASVPSAFDFYLTLRQSSETRGIPIVFLTELDPARVRQKLGANGDAMILQKPVQPGEVVQCLREFEREREEARETGKEIDILIAEDDAVTRRMLEYLLKKNGYTNLRLAMDGNQALAQFTQKAPELLILDYMMPHKNGFQVVEAIRKNPRYNHIPIVFLTAVDDKSKLIEALDAGATDYITKPFDRAELLARVQAHARNFYLQKKVRETNIKLEALNSELRKKSDQIQADLHSARKIQEALLPRELTACQSLDVNFFYQASNTVGGDFINIFKIDDSRIGFYIADVSGHGVTSALVTVFIREQINNILKKFDVDSLTPADILRQLNRNFNQEEYFIENGIYLTIVCGVIDLNRYRLSYASAGHHALPLMIDPHGHVTELRKLGVAIGFMEDFEYENYEMEFSKKHKLFLHTDGIIEMADDRNALFGMERLKNFLTENNQLKGERLLNALVKHCLSFSKNSVLQDDIALMLLEVK